MTTNAENATLVEAGRPDPLFFRHARPILGFETGVVLSATVAKTVLLPISGAFYLRIRGKLTQAGTIHLEWRRNVPNHATAYGASLDPPCTDITVSAATEFSQDIYPGGEAIMAMTWTPDGANAATVNFADILQL